MKQENTIIAKNPTAYHNYEILEKYEAGIVLFGIEIKSISNKAKWYPWDTIIVFERICSPLTEVKNIPVKIFIKSRITNIENKDKLTIFNIFLVLFSNST